MVQLPLGLLVGGYLLLSLLAAGLVLRALRAWLRDVKGRLAPHLYEVLYGALPRPAAAAFFLFAVVVGLRVLPLPASVETLTRRIVPFVLGMLVVTLVMRIALRAIDAYGQSSEQLRSTAGIGKAVTWIAGMALIAVIGSEAAGVSLAPALTALGVGSLAVALALQDTLANFFSGVYLLIDKPIRPGDFVRLGEGQEGYVEAIGWRSTHLRTLAPSVVIVPNATLSKAVITNFGRSNPRLGLSMVIDVAMASDPDAVERILSEEAARLPALPGVDGAVAPSVRFLPGVSDRGLSFTVSFTVLPTADGGLLLQELRKRVFARFREAGVVLAEPNPLARGRGA